MELIAALEGAFVLCRATRRTEALDVVGAAAASSVAAALSSGPPVPWGPVPTTVDVTSVRTPLIGSPT